MQFIPTLAIFCFFFWQNLSNILLSPSLVAVKFLDLFALLWDSYTPSKVVIFSWQLLLSRLQTRCNLGRRGVFGNSRIPSCVWCDGLQETEEHLFAKCGFLGTLLEWGIQVAWLQLGFVGEFVYFAPNFYFVV